MSIPQHQRLPTISDSCLGVGLWPVAAAGRASIDQWWLTRQRRPVHKVHVTVCQLCHILKLWSGWCQRWMPFHTCPACWDGRSSFAQMLHCSLWRLLQASYDHSISQALLRYMHVMNAAVSLSRTEPRPILMLSVSLLPPVCNHPNA